MTKHKGLTAAAQELLSLISLMTCDMLCIVWSAKKGIREKVEGNRRDI